MGSIKKQVQFKIQDSKNVSHTLIESSGFTGIHIKDPGFIIDISQGRLTVEEISIYYDIKYNVQLP